MRHFAGRSSRIIQALVVLTLAVSTTMAIRAQPPVPPQNNAYVTLAAQPQPPWRWGLEERLEMRSRAWALQRRQGRSQVDPDGNSLPIGPDVIRIDGAKAPELLLPWELFEALLSRGFAADLYGRAAYRNEIESRAKTLDDPSGIWEVLEVVAQDYLTIRKQVLALQRELDTSTPSRRNYLVERSREIQQSQCANRAAALQRARTHFGRATFDRFLYEAVAPAVRETSGISMERLTFIEKGCRDE